MFLPTNVGFQAPATLICYGGIMKLALLKSVFNCVHKEKRWELSLSLFWMHSLTLSPLKSRKRKQISTVMCNHDEIKMAE